MDLQDGKRMFGDIKSKLGFGSKDQDRGYDEEPFDDAYDYDDYADDYDDYEADEGYDRYAPVTTRAAGTSGTTPRLVSIDDVRANTQVPSSLNRDPLPPRHVTRSSSGAPGRTMVDSSLPPQMTPEGTAAEAAAVSRRRSEGLDSLFTPTTDAAYEGSGARSHARAASGAHALSDSAVEVQTSPASSAAVATALGAQSASSAYGTQAATSSSGGYTGRRTLTVLKPMSYGEVASMAGSLKAGEVVVLVLRNTPDNLSKRLLDFSFGVASALDASVDCIADQVFALACGGAISEVERMNLRNQGVL